MKEILGETLDESGIFNIYAQTHIIPLLRNIASGDMCSWSKTHYQVVNGYCTGTVNTEDTTFHVSFNLSGDGCEFDCHELHIYNMPTEVLYRNNDAICIEIPSINAQGKTETFYNIIPSYCLLHLTRRII